MENERTDNQRKVTEMIKKQGFKRIGIVILGSIIMGIGIHLTILSQLGSDPLTMLWIGLSDKLSISIGQANMLVSSVMLLIVFFIDRKELFIGSLLNPIVIALTTDILTNVSFQLDSLLFRVLLLVIGFTLMAFGIAVYSLASFGRGAYEALVFSLSTILHGSIRLVRTSFDCLFMLLGFLLGASLSFAPLLAILLMGVMIQFFVQRLIRPMSKYLGDAS